MRKNLFTFFTICLISFNLQSQTWAWASAPTGSGNTECVAVANDPSGNSFVTGNINSGANLVFGSTTLTTSGQKTFIAKYDPIGNALWARSSGGSNMSEIGWAVAADVNGNSFITGYFGSGTISFGSTTFTNTGSGNIGDAFLVKYDPNGNVLWARQIAGTGNEVGRGVCTDGSGNVIVSGNFSSPTIVVGTFTLTNTAIQTAYIIKYDMNGNVIWAKQSTSGGADVPYSVCADLNGNIIAAGSFDSFTTAFGAFTVTNLSTASPKEDMFIVKYSPTGIVLWASNASSSTQHDRAYFVDADASGNTYVTGYYNAFVSSMNCSGFLSKYSPTGSLLWTKYTSVGLGGSYGNIGYTLKTYTNGVWVGGAMSGSSISLGTTTVSVPSYIDPVYLAHYDQNGNVMYATAILSGGDDNFGVSVDINCNVIVASDFQPSSYAIGTNTIVNTGGESIFIAKLNYGCTTGIGIEQLNSETSNFYLYPNPTSDNLRIKTNSNINSEIQITNQIGQMVLKQKYSESVDVSKLVPGCYFIRIDNSYSKFIKE